MDAAEHIVDGTVAAAKNLYDGMNMGEAFSLSVLGFLIVFFVLVVLMAVITILRGALESMGSKPVEKAAAAAAPAPAPVVDPNAGKVPARGSLGDVKLYDVDDKIAAMVMAIVADEMKAPLNELRFISIREKKQA